MSRRSSVQRRPCPPHEPAWLHPGSRLLTRDIGQKVDFETLGHVLIRATVDDDVLGYIGGVPRVDMEIDGHPMTVFGSAEGCIGSSLTCALDLDDGSDWFFHANLYDRPLGKLRRCITTQDAPRNFVEASRGPLERGNVLQIAPNSSL